MAVAPSDVLLSWTSVVNRTYFLERATNLLGSAAFCLLQSNLRGRAGTTSFTDTDIPPGTPLFYRVGVQQ